MDENEFFRQATFQILSTLDLSKAVGRCLSYLPLVMPVAWMSHHLDTLALHRIPQAQHVKLALVLHL